MFYLKKYVRFVCKKKVFYLPPDGFDMYENDLGYTFDVPIGGCIIVDGKKYCDGVISYNKFTETIIGNHPQLCETEIVEEFIKQLPDLHKTIVNFLRCNPTCLDNTTSSSMISANPNSWFELSKVLKNDENLANIKLLETCGFKRTKEDLLRSIQGNIGTGEVSKLFFEFLHTPE